ncbi:MAG: oligopeptide ABC transporter ATP-binding protein [Caldilinea sp.]|nr:ABC transporter ATP-binding protein [Caldilinea sp.]GIV67271.1 MAG: oligopeptide ABC transporter ATP-binding protein [Caldilinea sp.]
MTQATADIKIDTTRDERVKPASDAPSTRPEQGALLSVRNLRVWFELRRFGFGHAGYVRAVDDVSFDLNYGETIAIVGESGCGKSSLMKTILGLHRPTEGEIYFENRRLNDFSRREMQWYRTQVGYVQQDPYGALPPFMNVRRILQEPLIIAGVKDPAEREARIRKALEEVKMTPVEEFLPKFPHMLSGGQQQRVVIARAMILNPKLLVADEPVSMLDASVRVEILRLLRALQQAHNLAVIYITHDLSTVRYFSRRIMVMYAGQVVEQGEVNDLLSNPKHPYTQALIEATSDPDAANAMKFREVPSGEPPSLVRPPAGCRFHPRCAYFIADVCDKETPPDFDVGQGHLARCWLYR